MRSSRITFKLERIACEEIDGYVYAAVALLDQHGALLQIVTSHEKVTDGVA